MTSGAAAADTLYPFLWDHRATLSPLVFAALAAPALWKSLSLTRRNRRLADLPVSKVQGVFVGLVELNGTAETESPVRSHLAGRVCVLYAWRIEESWTRLVTETYRDDQGKTQTRTKRETGWTTVAQGGSSQDFYLRDDTGVLRIRPADAKLELSPWLSQRCTESDPLYYGKGPAGRIPDSDGVRLFTESGIALHEPLFVAGPARERDDLVAPEIAADPASPEFLVSTRTRQAVLRGMRAAGWGFALAGFAFAATPLVLWCFDFLWVADTPLLVLAGLPVAYLLAWPLGWVWMVYNGLVELRQRVRQGWSQVDVQLKRRHDLIPALVAICERLAAHERDVQETVAHLRTQLAATPPGQPGPDPSGCGPALRVLAERYPTLVADDAFLSLQRQLIETEQRIALARGYYNDIATFYTTRQQRFPELLVARLGTFRPAPLLAAEAFERAAVTVHLVDGARA